MAAPTTEVTTVSSEVDPSAPPSEQQRYGPAKDPPNPYNAPPVVTWGTGTTAAESDKPQEEPVAPPNEEPEGPRRSD